MAVGPKGIVRLIQLILDRAAAKRAERDMQESLRRGTDSRDAARRLTLVERGWNKVRLAALGFAAAGVGTLVGVMRKVIGETAEAEAVQAQLAARIKSTGSAAGQSVEALNAHAEALQKVTTFSDEAIGSAQALLLTFTNIRGDTFKEATEAVLDMSTALGQDLSTSALQLGKALNDPIKGVTALGRAGVQFSEAQKALIKGFVETNDLASAQALILRELETQMGGSAEAARNTLGGALQHLSNMWGELFEATDEATTGIVNDINLIADNLPKLRTGLGLVYQAVLHPTTAFYSFAKALGLTKDKTEEATTAFQNLGPTAFGVGDSISTAGNAADDAADSLGRAASAAAALREELQRLDAQRAAGGNLPSVDEILAGAARGDQAAVDRFLAEFEQKAKERFGKGQGFTPGAGGTGAAPVSGAGTEIRPLEETFGQSVADGLKSVWEDFFGSMKDDTEEAGVAFQVMAEAFAGSWEGAIKRVSKMKAMEMLARALEAGAHAIFSLATGNFAAAGAYGKSAAEFGGAAAAYGLAAAAAPGGGGSGAAGQGVSVGGGGRATDGTQQMSPVINVYVDGLDPDNPKHIQLVQRTVVNANQRYGANFKPTVRRYGSNG